MDKYQWLPELIMFEDYDNDFSKYVEVLYDYYNKEILHGNLKYGCNLLSIKKTPLIHGRHATFNHLINDTEFSSTKKEEDRIPNLRRCERIRWIKAFLDNLPNYKELYKVWENERKGEKSILIWAFEKDYLIVIRKRKDYLLFYTAYPIEHNHTKRKLEKEFEEYKKTGNAC